MSGSSYDLSSLQAEIATAVTTHLIEDAVRHEACIQESLIKLRNVGDCVHDQYDVSGMLFSKTSSFAANETKFNDLWNITYAHHIKDCQYEKISCHDTWISKTITKLFSDPFWYEIGDAEALQSDLPSFRLSSIEYYNARMEKMYSVTDDYTRPDSIFMSTDTRDRDIELRDDLAYNTTSSRKLSAYLRFRMMDDDPYYASHPIEFLLVTVLYLKTVCPTYVNPVMIFFDAFIKRLNTDERWKSHIPVEFHSDGGLASLTFHSHILMFYKVMLNSMALLLTYQNVHSFEDYYINTSNEMLIYCISHGVTISGRKLKKLFTIPNLYYGMDMSDHEAYATDHLHPRYPTYIPTNEGNPIRTSEYKKSIDCTRCEASRLSKSVYTRNLRDKLSESLEELRNEGLVNLAAYIADKLTICRPSPTIIHDLIFIRIHLNVGGYSHTHQLTDFDEQINKSLKDNKDYISEVQTNPKHAWIFNAMRECGHDMTRVCIEKGVYPTAASFKKELNKYTTSRSSGITPFSVDFQFKHKIHNRKKIMTAKNANLMVMGDKSLNLNNLNLTYLGKDEFLLGLTDAEKQLWKDGKLSTHIILNKRSISRIGSRATVAFRPIRPIYINPLNMHFAQAAILGPHVEISNLRITDQPAKMFPSSHDMGNGISTMFQDGTVSLVSNSVMSSSSGLQLNVCADASNWDQHFPTEMINAYLDGVKLAIKNDKCFNNEYYLYFDDVGATIPDIVDWLKEAHNNRAYLASYAGANIIYLINFMTSGSLYTFYLNSILNLMINRQIDNRLRVMGHRYTYVQKAGDDSIALMQVSNRTNSKDIEDIKNVIVDVYAEANQRVNAIKTSVSAHSGEFAKMYWYYGMIFRDPSIQWFESEKESRSESYIEKIRGYAQKLFEASKRAIGNLRLNASYARVILSLSYHMNTRIPAAGSKNTSEKMILLKYYPPSQSIFVPTSYSGGLGYTLSGVCLNEIQMIINHLLTYTNQALHVIDALTFDVDRAIINGIFKYYYPNKLDVLGDLTRNTNSHELHEVQFSSDDVNMSDCSFRKGIDFQQSQLNHVHTEISNRAKGNLLKNNIKLPVKYKYDNAPFYNFYQTIDVMSVDKTAVSRSLEYNISKLFMIIGKSIILSSKIAKTKIDIRDKYAVYAAFDITLHTKRPAVNRQQHIRYISAPDYGYDIERRYGSVHDRHYASSIRNSNIAILKFIKTNGLSMTETMLMDTIMESQVFLAYSPEDALYNLLLYISGHEGSSATLCKVLLNEKLSWESELISTSVNGTILENIDLNKPAIDKFIQCIPGVHVTLINLIRYMSFIYSIQYGAFNTGSQYDVRISLNSKYDELIATMVVKRAIGRERRMLKAVISEGRSRRRRYVNFMTDDRMLL